MAAKPKVRATASSTAAAASRGRRREPKPSAKRTQIATSERLEHGQIALDDVAVVERVGRGAGEAGADAAGGEAGVRQAAAHPGDEGRQVLALESGSSGCTKMKKSRRPSAAKYGSRPGSARPGGSGGR